MDKKNCILNFNSIYFYVKTVLKYFLKTSRVYLNFIITTLYLSSSALNNLLKKLNYLWKK